MLTRAITGIVFVSLVLYASFHPGAYFLLFLFFESIVIFEAARMFDIKGLKLLGLSAFLFFFTIFSLSTMFLSNMVLALVIISHIVLIVELFWDKILPSFVRIAIFVSIFGGFLSLLLLPFDGQIQYDPWKAIFIFGLVWASDTFAYLFGVTLGRTKLLERVSPKKSVEGLLGGALVTGLLAFFIATYFGLSRSIWLSMGMMIPFYGTLGDLVVSKLKRSVGVKDTGSILPGHGGVYDRLDSVLFIAPLVYYVFYYGLGLSDYSLKTTQQFIYFLNHL